MEIPNAKVWPRGAQYAAVDGGLCYWSFYRRKPTYVDMRHLVNGAQGYFIPDGSDDVFTRHSYWELTFDINAETGPPMLVEYNDGSPVVVPESEWELFCM